MTYATSASTSTSGPTNSGDRERVGSRDRLPAKSRAISSADLVGLLLFTCVAVSLVVVSVTIGLLAGLTSLSR